MNDEAVTWPALSYSAWRDTATTLHLWTQIVGKVRLALTPRVNHSWQVPLYVTARGLGTSPIPSHEEVFEMEFDLIGHRLLVRASWGAERTISLEPQAVGDFHRRVVDLLDDMGIAVRIGEMPNEIANPIPFSRDRTHASYDANAAHAFWRALVRADRLFKLFRSGFLGKVSPVHFFWGSFDLAVTRFSGPPAPPHPCRVLAGHEACPQTLLLEFLSSTYAAAADAASWDRAALECRQGAPGKVRQL